MNLTPVLVAAMPARLSAPAPSDARLPGAADAADGAAPSGLFARTLGEAGARSQSTNGAASDNGAHAANTARAGDAQAVQAAPTDVTHAGPAGAAASAPSMEAPPAKSAKATASTTGPVAVAAQAQPKARAALAEVDAAAATPSVHADTESSTLSDTPTAVSPEATAAGDAADAADAATTLLAELQARHPVPTATQIQGDPALRHEDGAEAAPPPAMPGPATAAGGAADAATTLLAELQARHPVPTATQIQGDPALRHEDGAATAASQQPRRPLAATAAPADPPALAAAGAEAAPPPAMPGPATDATAAALPATAMPPATAPVAALQPAPSAAPVAEARLRASPGSAEFASQLGSQLTTFVRDGVEEARLHLNPAELGPVTVQIRIHGQAAQVHMAAEHGLTRQALEQAMPLLAGSLREAGLTLSGGGVFEQPRQSRDDSPPGTAAGSRPSREGADDVALRPGPTPVRRRGVVDLVA